MAVEEIDMAVPVGWQERDTVPDYSAERGTDRMPRGSIVDQVRQAVRRRRRLALTRRQRIRRWSEFDQKLRVLIKRIAADASNQVDDRQLRGEIRIQIYGAMAGLVGVLVQDHIDVQRRARNRVKVCAGLVFVLCCTAVALLLAAEVLVVPSRFQGF